MEIANRNEWIIIGISGVTCGGKTTLANKLAQTLTPVYVFNQDRYFYPDDSSKHVLCEGLAHNNYDILSSLDMEKMYSDLLTTMGGEDKADYSSRERRSRHGVAGKKFLVVEGFTTLNYTPIMELCDLRYYFILEYAECYARRSLREYDPPDIPGYFEQCVWPEHLRYRAEIERHPLVRMLDSSVREPLQNVLEDLRQLGLAPVN